MSESNERIPNPDFVPLAMASGTNPDGTYTAVIRVHLRAEDVTALRAANLVPLIDSNSALDWGSAHAATATAAEAVRTAHWGELTPLGAEIWIGSSTSSIPGGQFLER